ncbi:septal ring lytic transglycosylase RlpA family protein [Marinoscillum pacificum]|uniref:septal ring lytic transglycosylase RlpA family protein n=1 Tax=Marinoscillum pacificum TaxID=392723 RepID=UPI00280BD79E|nr:septal ring lytic transglycosylase RlpA family protein [Marinoscillum pacificum]
MRLFLLLLTVFVTSSVIAQTQTGQASFYGGQFHGRPTASGEVYDMEKMTAAHRTLPFGTMIRVTNTNNGKSVVVKVNDRGPFVDSRIVDLSFGAAKEIEMVNDGVVDVTLELVQKDLAPTPTVNNSFFHIEINRLKPAGYGVQIMSFAQTDNYVTFVEQLQKKYNSADIVLQSKMVNGQKVIGVILGQYGTRTEAESYRESLINDYPDSYIIEYSKFH